MKTMKKDIQHNLEVAKPRVQYFIKNMSRELSQWIQYAGVEIKPGHLYFRFKSSDNSLNFTVYAGVNINDIGLLLRAQSNYIYNFFDSFIREQTK